MGSKEHEIEEKMRIFKNQLKSKKPEDVKANAELLAEILKNFSFSFNVGIEEIVQMVKKEKGSINLQNVRNTLFNRYN